MSINRELILFNGRLYSMMRSMFLILAVVIALVGGSVFAQDSIPNEDPTENACYAGGVMSRVDGEGCATEWAWQCGWYLASWQKVGGWYPDWCESVFPSVESVPVPPFPGCVQLSFYYTNFGNSLTIPHGSIIYLDSECTINYGLYGRPHVYATSLADAQALCLNTFNTVNVRGPFGLFVYECS
jgi:hypothetical protein